MIDGRRIDVDVSAEHWELLGIVAADAGCDQSQYISDGLAVALDAANIVLMNRNQGKDQTCILLEQPEGHYEPSDLCALFTDGAAGLISTDIGVMDPFASAERVLIPIDDAMHEEIISICETLDTTPMIFVQAAIDLRRELQVAGKNNRVVYIETVDDDEFFEVPTSF